MLESYLSRYSSFSNLAGSRLGRFKRENEGIDSRKIRQLKVLVSAMMSPKIHQEPSITGSGYGRYTNYGCHCMPEHDGVEGFGQPLDKIDETCKQLSVCYSCLAHKYSDCDPKETGYAFSINHNTKEIDCSMNDNQCRRDVCECDKRLAIDIAKYEFTWNENYHSLRSDFDRDSTCGRRVMTEPTVQPFEIPSNWAPQEAGSGVNWGAGGTGPGGDITSSAQCCNLDHFPYVTALHGTHACCGYGLQKPYNTLTHQCCDGEVIYKNESCV